VEFSTAAVDERNAGGRQKTSDARAKKVVNLEKWYEKKVLKRGIASFFNTLN